MMKKLLLAFLLSAAFAPEALAQAANCRVTTVAPTYANNTTAPLSCEPDGDLRATGATTITANAGTNLNTSALALEATLSSVLTSVNNILTAVQIMDDWDETDRAKVNIIAGQAGITAGAGAVAANTPRVTHASDDPVTTAVQIIDNAISGSGVNVSQINGVTPLMGNGVTGTGSPRVTIASDNTAFTVNVGTFPDNEPVNVAQMNGVAITMGNGASGTGVQRVTLANDSTGILAAVTNVATIGTSITPGTAATNLGKAEDAAHASADVGVLPLTVQTAVPVNRASTDGDYEPLQSSGGHTWVALPVTTKVSVSFNRPANVTAYAVNDAVNDNATAGGGSSTELSWTISRSAGNLQRVRIKKTDQAVATATLRLWLYDTVFVSAAGDNEALVHPATNSIGYCDVAVTTAGTDDAVGWSNCDVPFTGATLYGQLQTLSIYTPANAETYTVDLWYQPG